MRLQTSAFLVRSLRQESRFVSHHIMRSTLAGLILLLLFSQLMSYALRAGAGGAFSSTVMMCCYWFVTLLGGVYFSTTIVEEKEEQTLPLLRMTGASSFSILLGKSVPRLVSVILLILVISPFLMLAATLGGVVFRGVVTAVFGIMVYAVMFCQIGLFASVVSGDAQRAFSKTLIIWALLEFFPFWCWLASFAVVSLGGFENSTAAIEYLSTEIGEREWHLQSLSWLHLQLQWLGGWADELVLLDNLPMYLTGFSDEPVWRSQMTAHLIVALVFFFLSWILFEPFTARVVAEGNVTPGKRSRKNRRSRRPWRNALVWKSWQHIAGGWVWFFVRLVGIPVFVFGIVAISAFAMDESLDKEVLAFILIVTGAVTVIANVAILFGRLFNTEIQERTLDAVLMLPRTTGSIVFQCIIGMVPALLASASSFVCGVYLLSAIGSHSALDMDDYLFEPWTYQIVMWSITTVSFGLLLSVRLRYGGMLLAIVALWMLAPVTVGSCLSVIFIRATGRGSQLFVEDVLPVMLIVVEIPACVWLHFAILRSLERAGEQA